MKGLSESAMKIEFVYGPKVGHIEHVSREVGAALLAGGFAVEKSSAEEVSRQHTIPPHPPKGYRVVRIGSLNEKVAICFDDGMGGHTLYESEPGPTRRWVYNPETGAEGYELVPSDCPPEVIREFKRLGGGKKDLFAESDAGDAYRQRLAQQQYEMDEQNKKVHGALHGLKG